MTPSPSTPSEHAASPADYMVGGLIGEGSFGRVVLGKHKATGKDVAIKVIDKCSAQKRPQLSEAVWKERTLLAQWNDTASSSSSSSSSSSYTVALLSAFHDEECLYLVMECCAGGTLLHHLTSGLKDEESRKRWYASIPHYGLQLVNALEFIHTQRVIHADLKPDNVLMTQTGQLKLGDFGSCILLDAPAASSPATRMTTASYAPPELLRGLPTSQLTVGVDLWSFGCVLATMFLGKSPFDAPTEALTVQAISDYARVQDSTRYQVSLMDSSSSSTSSSLDVPRPFQALIHDLLNPNPISRCQAVMLDETTDGGNHGCYHQWKKQHVWKDQFPSSREGLFRAPPPAWWTDASPNQLRDGAQGWTAFLL
eukprot:CAMPEP_0194026720 /NCGR_PEP_ID=MMETSP0009_2-20130614/1018_1 /TAXON_ID=210454 /ORGANISM="Grammatophora oceanica, Strain CCMP 410" /LENGTH=367 /DNA_ID=CAMNT_0038665563 /DNA_START=79 /DNA_END=1182 /DNA_ORIENTATION=-